MAARLVARSVLFFRRYLTLTPEEAALQRRIDGSLPGELAAMEARNAELREAFYRDYARAHIWPRLKFGPDLVPRLEARAPGAEAPHGLPPAYGRALAAVLAAIPSLLVLYLVERAKRDIAAREAAAGAPLLPPIYGEGAPGAPAAAAAAAAAAPLPGLEARIAALEVAAAAAAAPTAANAAAPPPAGAAPPPQGPLA